MNKYFLMMLLAAAVGGWAMPAFAQSSVPYDDEEVQRFQFMAHNYSAEGVEHEIYVKLDRFTGKTWRFSADNPKWMTIPEATNGKPRGASNTSRYELYAHNYVDKDGQPQEILIRTDAMSGYTWAYRGANGTWSDIPQE
jgi:hypothetical protein